MPHRYVIRRLDALPWPHGLGKDAGPGHPYKELDRRLRSYLGDERHFQRAAHQYAYESDDPEYRRIVLDALNQLPWSTRFLENEAASTTLARSAPLLNQTLRDDQSRWEDWARPQCPDGLTRSWLGSPAVIGTKLISDGRHRITYLRFHRPPEHEVLVCVTE